MVAVTEHMSYCGIRIQLSGPKSWGRMNQEWFFSEFTGLSAHSWFLLIVGHRVVGLYTLSYMSLYSVRQFAKSFHIHSLPTLVWPIWDGQKRNDRLRLMGEGTGTEKLRDLLQVTQIKGGGARSQTLVSCSSSSWLPTVRAVFSWPLQPFPVYFSWSLSHPWPRSFQSSCSILSLQCSQRATLSPLEAIL